MYVCMYDYLKTEGTKTYQSSNGNGVLKMINKSSKNKNNGLVYMINKHKKIQQQLQYKISKPATTTH